MAFAINISQENTLYMTWVKMTPPLAVSPSEKPLGRPRVNGTLGPNPKFLDNAFEQMFSGGAFGCMGSIWDCICYKSA